MINPTLYPTLYSSCAGDRYFPPTSAQGGEHGTFNACVLGGTARRRAASNCERPTVVHIPPSGTPARHTLSPPSCAPSRRLRESSAMHPVHLRPPMTPLTVSCSFCAVTRPRQRQLSLSPRPLSALAGNLCVGYRTLGACMHALRCAFSRPDGHAPLDLRQVVPCVKMKRCQLSSLVPVRPCTCSVELHCVFDAARFTTTSTRKKLIVVRFLLISRSSQHPTCVASCNHPHPPRRFTPPPLSARPS